LKADTGSIHKVIGFQETIVYNKFDDNYGALFDVVKS